MKSMLNWCSILAAIVLLSGCASPVPKGLQFYTKSVTAPKTTVAEIYSRSRTWIAMNEDRYHLQLNFADAKAGTIVFTGRAYSRSCHNVMNDCAFLSYNVLQKITPNHFTLTFSEYRFYLNAQDPGQAADLRQFQQLEPLFQDITQGIKHAVFMTSAPLRASSQRSAAVAHHVNPGAKAKQ